MFAIEAGTVGRLLSTFDAVDFVWTLPARQVFAPFHVVRKNDRVLVVKKGNYHFEVPRSQAVEV